MTEKDWLEATRPDPLLRHVAGKVSARKMALFTAACHRRALRGPGAGAQVYTLELCEQAEKMGPDDPHTWSDGMSCESLIPAAVRLHFPPAVLDAVRDRRTATTAAWSRWQAAWEEAMQAERVVQCDLARDIFGNPFRPVVLDLGWLRDNALRALGIARTIYDAGTFDDLPILADMLEEAGLDNRDLLDHLRSGCVHTRGCWALDLLLELR
jgi:hypothetical protein